MTNIPLPSNRSFAFTFAVVFFLIAGFLWWKESDYFQILLIASLIFAVAGRFFSRYLTPLNRLWMHFGHLLHRIISPIILGLMFFIVITPFGGIMRLFGYNPMHKNYDDSASSYWIPRDPPGPDKDSFYNQF